MRDCLALMQAVSDPSSITAKGGTRSEARAGSSYLSLPLIRLLKAMLRGSARGMKELAVDLRAVSEHIFNTAKC